MPMPLVLSPPIATIRGKTIAVAAGITAAVALPQALHLLGAATGVGPALGQALLPMFLPVLLVGLLAGRVAGGLTGAVAPVAAFLLSGMPALSLLGPISAQLAALGLIAGLLASVRMPNMIKVLLALGGSWLARLAVVAASGVAALGVWDAIVAGWPGMAVQLLLAPFVLRLVKKYDH